MIAVDTNVLVYRIDRREPAKRAIARRLMQQLRSEDTPTILPWQVLAEFLRYLHYWKDSGELSQEGVFRYLAVVRAYYPVIMPFEAVIDQAIDMAARHSLSHWDSMLLGACKDAGVTTLYTEDMGAPTRFDSIELVNPFT